MEARSYVNGAAWGRIPCSSLRVEIELLAKLADSRKCVSAAALGGYVLGQGAVRGHLGELRGNVDYEVELLGYQPPLLCETRRRLCCDPRQRRVQRY